MMKAFGYLAATLIAVSGAAHGQSHDGHSHSGGHEQAAPLALPTEPGQGAFAAMSEIVAMLREDPATDWTAVDIDALQGHLADMALLALHAQVSVDKLSDGLEMTISTAGDAGQSAARMVPAHGPVLAAETGWASQVVQNQDNVVWRVTSQQDAAQIRALGFWGLMATGDHHREHHLGIATGQMVH